MAPDAMDDAADDNPKAFKHWFSRALVEGLGDQLKRLDRRFDRDAYRNVIAPLETLELKARVALIAEALGQAIKRPFPEAAELLVRSLPPAFDPATANGQHFIGWALAHYVGRFGLAHPEPALSALHAITQRFTAEFDIRHFLLADPTATLATLRTWARDPSEHVRRLVLEGTRTRLPWGIRLQPFIDDPTPLLPLLDALHQDPSPYVRRSVANNLNDLAKDHPELVIERLARWASARLAEPGPPAHQAHADHLALVRRALRTLIKQGHPGALALLGVEGDVDTVNFVAAKRVVIGQSLLLEATLTNPGARDAKVVVDFALHYRSANGTVRAPKVFKWKTFALPAGETVALAKSHPMRDVSIRRHFIGAHRVDLLVNGVAAASRDFQLTR